MSVCLCVINCFISYTSQYTTCMVKKKYALAYMYNISRILNLQLPIKKKQISYLQNNFRKVQFMS